MIDGAPELRGKVTMSWYLIVAVVVLAFSMGGTITKVLDNDSQREADVKQLESKIRKLEEFVLAEIQGHRSDCDRRFNEVVKPRIEDLESQHKVYKIE